MTGLHSEGFRVVPGVLRPEEVDTLRQTITDAIDRVARAMLTPFESSLPSVW